MDFNSKIAQFKTAIRDINLNTIQSSADIPESLQMARDGKIAINYIPFDYVNKEAKLVLVGITPGFTQLKNALLAAQTQIKSGSTDAEILIAAKKTGAFSGTMRPNLTAMLDHLNVHGLLGIRSTEELFGSSNHLVHTTSLLRHPVFVDGENYNGQPNMTKHPLLLSFLKDYFLKEVEGFRDAIFVPLGPKVLETMEWLVSKGLMDGERILGGIPHPSGANAERIAYFLGNKPESQLSIKTNPQLIDSAKTALRKKIDKIKPSF